MFSLHHTDLVESEFRIEWSSGDSKYSTNTHRHNPQQTLDNGSVSAV